MGVTSDASLQYDIVTIYYQLGYTDSAGNVYAVRPTFTLPSNATDTTTFDNAMYGLADAMTTAGLTVNFIMKYLSPDGQFFDNFIYPRA